MNANKAKNAISYIMKLIGLLFFRAHRTKHAASAFAAGHILRDDANRICPYLLAAAPADKDILKKPSMRRNYFCAHLHDPHYFLFSFNIPVFNLLFRGK